MARALRATTVCCVTILAARAANAEFSIVFSPDFGSTESTGATARVDLMLSDTAADPSVSNVLLTMRILNTTSEALVGAATLTGVGFQIPFGLYDIPPGDAVFIPSTYQSNLGGIANAFPEFFNPADLAKKNLNPFLELDGVASDDLNFLGSDKNSGPGLLAGQWTLVSVEIDTDLSAAAFESAWLNSATRLDENGDVIDGLAFGARFQSVGWDGEGSDKVRGGVDAIVPAPPSLALLGIGAACMTVIRRRRGRSSQVAVPRPAP